MLFRRLTFLVLVASLALCAQNQPAGSEHAKPRLSPPGQASFAFADGKQITVDYSRPSMRGRKIMGDLVPYGKVWRTGANEATSFVTDTDLDLAGTRVPAGKYTLYTIPDEKTWTIIINNETGQWGTEYHPDRDRARVTAVPAHLEEPIEEFTISFEKRTGQACVMKLEWENTSVPVNLSEAK
jgi:hypothetical protein